MIPGSNQSPSDIDTMVMVLNDAGDRFVEKYKPIEEVRAVALQRLDAMCLRTKEWHYPVSTIEAECKEFVKGTRLTADAEMIDGVTVHEKVIAAFRELKKPEIRAALDRKRDEMIAAINAESDAVKMLEIAKVNYDE